jgi:dTDP-4-amino-4,6-dideoxygalactose transaminase
MNDISAAIGLANLEDWPKILAHKKKINKIYEDNGLYTGAWMAWGFTDDYDGLKSALNAAGYEMGQHHYRNDKYTVFGKRVKLPNMDYIEKRYFFIPSHYFVTVKQAREIAKICNLFQSKFEL